MHNSSIKYNIVVDISMYKTYITIVFVFFSILISSLNFPLNNTVLLAEGQQQQKQSTISESTKNVTELSTLNGKNSSITLENKTVDYFENANGYLVYPISTTTTSSSIESNISANNNNTFPAVVMIHEWWGLNENIKNMAETLAKEGYVVLEIG